MSTQTIQSEHQDSRTIFYNHIWQDYRQLRRCDHVLRTGFYNYGINYKSDSILKTMKNVGFLDDKQLLLLTHELAKLDPENTNKPESVNEHSFGAIEIARGIARYFPHVLNNPELHRVIRILHYHDLPEKDVGDIPDNGNRDEIKKNTDELAVLKFFTSAWPEPERDDLVRDYQLFQKPWFDHPDVCDRHFAQIAYLCDKLDAALRAITYEANGHIGARIPIDITERELNTIEAVDSDNIVDCWSYQFLNTVMPKDYIHYHLFAGILKSAVLDVRKTWFSWAKDIAV